LRSSGNRCEFCSAWIADHRLIECFVSSREVLVFEALSNAFAREVADRVGLLPEGGAELIGFL
jgi:hypothetical protein